MGRTAQPPARGRSDRLAGALAGWAAPLLVIATAVVPHLGSLGAGFTQDDRVFVVMNASIRDLGSAPNYSGARQNLSSVETALGNAQRFVNQHRAGIGGSSDAQLRASYLTACKLLRLPSCEQDVSQ